MCTKRDDYFDPCNPQGASTMHDMNKNANFKSVSCSSVRQNVLLSIVRQKISDNDVETNWSRMAFFCRVMSCDRCPKTVSVIVKNRG